MFKSIKCVKQRYEIHLKEQKKSTKEKKWRACCSKPCLANYHSKMLLVGRHNKEIRCIICWHDEQRRRKEHDALCQWREFIKRKSKETVKQLFVLKKQVEELQIKKSKLVREIQTHTMHSFESIWRCFSFDVQSMNQSIRFFSWQNK